MNLHQSNRKLSNDLIVSGFNNVLKCSKGDSETRNHRLKKFLIADFCWRNSLDFATEVTFRDNSRCDVLIKDWLLAIEVLCSENITDFLRKAYPVNTLPIQASTSREEIESILNDLMATDGAEYTYYRTRLVNRTKE